MDSGAVLLSGRRGPTGPAGDERLYRGDWERRKNVALLAMEERVAVLEYAARLAQPMQRTALSCQSLAGGM
eukprot:scaffold3141_cov350-Prasinococcus_capsulatus_cf.AAC.6